LRFTTNDALKGTPYEAGKELLDRRDEVGLPQAKVYKGIQFVPSGVGKIAILQSEGFAYLKVQ
jgi:hypothetical protein